MKRSVIHRKGTPKSRNGCMTCKIRRIKCDETHPACLRCLSTGRKCDGYAAVSQNRQSGDTRLLGPSGVRTRANSFPVNMLEQRSFEFFRSRTVVDIAGHFDSPLWGKLVLQASYSEPAVQYAASALGALHEKVELQRSIECLPGQSQYIDFDFPILQYTKALVSIRKLLDRSDTRSIELVLISCLMCIYYELLQENYPTAWTHLEKALKVIKQPYRAWDSWPASKSPYRQVNLIAVDDNLIEAFARLDVQASSYLSGRRPRLLTMILPRDMPARFTSLSQSREALNRILGQLHYFVWSKSDKFKCGSQVFVPIPAVAEVNCLKHLLETWAESFSDFLDHQPTELTQLEECGKRVLLIQYSVAHIKTITYLNTEKGIFDRSDDEFNKILSHAEFILSNEEKADSSRVPLSLDLAIIEALFGTAIKCRSPSIRHRAADLLRKVHWREGVWDASLMASIADKFIAAEEVLGDPKANSALSPVSWRVHDVGFTIDWETLRVKLFCTRRPEDGGWIGQRDFLTW